MKIERKNEMDIQYLLWLQDLTTSVNYVLSISDMPERTIEEYLQRTFKLYMR